VLSFGTRTLRRSPTSPGDWLLGIADWLRHQWFDGGVASLLDPLPGDVLRFLRITADGYAAAGGQWPCWQWVRQELWTRHDLDAEEILLGMPAWEYDYRPVLCGGDGQWVALQLEVRDYVGPARWRWVLTDGLDPPRGAARCS
jgi:hypothetical protein